MPTFDSAAPSSKEMPSGNLRTDVAGTATNSAQVPSRARAAVGHHKRGFCVECGSRLTVGENREGTTDFVGINGEVLGRQSLGACNLLRISSDLLNTSRCMKVSW